MLIKITRINNRYVGGDGSGFADVAEPAYINPDAIVSVSPSKDMSCLYIHMGAGDADTSYCVSAEEWARLEPLIVTPEPQKTAYNSAVMDQINIHSILYSQPGVYKIDAIKAYRVATHCGLKEAKDAVEAWMKDNPRPRLQTPTLPQALLDAYERADHSTNWQDVGLILFPALYKIITGEDHKRDLGDEYNRAPALPANVVEAYRKSVLKREQDSEFVYEADDELVEALSKIIPAPSFTDEELDS